MERRGGLVTGRSLERFSLLYCGALTFYCGRVDTSVARGSGGPRLGVGYQASVIWNPMDYLRFMAQVGRTDITGGPRTATVDPTSTEPLNERKYHNNQAALRAQVEF